MRTLSLPSGRQIPVLGQGTWGMGEQSDKWQAEVAALRLGLDLGMNLIDAAEMYGEGAAELVVAEAIAGRRTEVFLVNKVLPQNASRRGTIEACGRSLDRLKTDHIDLYLLHWRGSVPLSETLEAFRSLKQAGKIRDYGVSNFDQTEMEEAILLPGGSEIATDQVLYNLMHRGIEWDLLPWCRKQGMPIMAYSPIEQGEMLDDPNLNLIASRRGASPAQIALAWLLRQQGVSVIAKAGMAGHVKDNRGALDITLTDEDLADLDRSFPPPHRKLPLEMK